MPATTPPPNCWALPTRPYHQKAYVTCLDLGEAGALFTRGWERKVEMVGDVAKKTKQEINTVWIYPPKAERAAALASADPERVTRPLDVQPMTAAFPAGCAACSTKTSHRPLP